MTKPLAAPSLQTRARILRVLGTDVTLIEPLKRAAEADLGLKLEFIVLDGIAAQRRGVLAPESFDIYDQWSHDLDLVWPARSLKPIDIARIENWEEVREWPVARQKLHADPHGNTPFDRLYVQSNGELSCQETDLISMLPTVYNADSFAIVGESAAPAPQSWADLLAEQWRGRVAIQADAAIGVPDLLMALRARAEFSCDTPEDLSLAEIGTFIRLIKHYQLSGHFAGFWTDKTPKPTGAPLLSTMWWSNYLAQKAKGVPIRMCSPVEGYRGWSGGMAFSQNLDAYSQDLAYAYLNWWLTGPAGAIMARNGAYMAAPRAARQYLSANESGFWYDGKPAVADICDPYGRGVYRAGETREGGSCETRQDQIVIWNSVMSEHNSLVRLWDVITQAAMI